MSDYGTLNPRPSIDPRDLDDNATVFDQLLNGPNASYPDRFGVQRKSWAQMEDDAAALVSPNVAALAALPAALDKAFFFNAVTPVGMGSYTLTSFSRSLGSAVDAPAFRTAIGAMNLNDTGAYAGSAAKFTNARILSATSDVTWSVSFDGSANVSAAATLAATGITAGTYGSVTVDAKGRATAGAVATPVANGGTNATTAAGARTSLQLDPTAWANFTLAASWTVISTRRAAYRKFLDFVQIEVQITGGTSTDGTVFATLPVGFRPANPLIVSAVSGPNTTPTSSIAGPRVLIGTDGTMACFNCSAAAGLCFSAMLSTS